MVHSASTNQPSMHVHVYILYILHAYVAGALTEKKGHSFLLFVPAQIILSRMGGSDWPRFPPDYVFVCMGGSVNRSYSIVTPTVHM